MLDGSRRLLICQSHRLDCFHHLCHVLDHGIFEKHHSRHHLWCLRILVLLQQQHAQRCDSWSHAACLDIQLWKYQFRQLDRGNHQHASTGMQYCSAAGSQLGKRCCRLCSVPLAMRNQPPRLGGAIHQPLRFQLHCAIWKGIHSCRQGYLDVRINGWLTVDVPLT